MSSVFLSSTWQALRDHRAKVIEALDRLRLAGFIVEWFGMEGFPASQHEDSLTAALRMLDTCDTYVGVLGPRYGSTPEGHTQSYTELEYEHARAEGKPRALFLMDQSSEEWDSIGEEPDVANRRRLTALRSRFEHDRLLNYFDSPGDLAMKVVIAILPRVMAERDLYFTDIYSRLQPAHRVSRATYIALTASPAVISANGIENSTITAKITDAGGNNVPDGEEVVFLSVGFGVANPTSTTTTGGSASTIFTPYPTNSSGRAYITCLVPNASLSGIIAVDYVGATR